MDDSEKKSATSVSTTNVSHRDQMTPQTASPTSMVGEESVVQNHASNSLGTGNSSVTTSQPEMPKKKLGVGRTIVLLVLAVVLCGAAGLGGAWLYGTIAHSDNVKETRVTVEAEGEAISKVVSKVSPSVVSVLTEGKTVSDYYGSQDTAGAGTGVIISKDGYVVTNKHVIPDGTTKVSVVLADGTQIDNVTVAGRDPLNDIAFLKIPGVDNLTPATIGNSDDAKIGQKVIAIGNALGEYQNTVTSGIISGTGRSLTAQTDSNGGTETLNNLIQTDAAINPGNSGGPLVTYDGKVIGINTAIVENAQSLGFSIPISEASGMIDSLLSTGKVSRAYLGVRYVNLTPAVAKQLKLSTNYGAYIDPTSKSAIASGSPAAKAGIKAGDIITAINGVTIDADHPLASQTGRLKPGDKVDLTILRDGKEVKISVILSEYK